MWTLPLDQIDDQWTSLRSGSTARNVPTLALAGATTPAASTFPYPVGGNRRAVASRPRPTDDTELGTAQHGSPRCGSGGTGRPARRRDDRGVPVLHQRRADHQRARLDSGGIDRAESLRASRLHAVGMGFTGQPPAALADKTWLYCPRTRRCRGTAPRC
ncbi:hypothetical protein [Mycolicibacterium sp. PDY-3]|uniref:hypothetical protein n=1 Tax=Mycolicibacterium sp. PDY-3 TaxID=3376069 RepID=UPI0037B0DFFA